MSAIRVTGQFDNDGNPMYALKAANQMVVAESPPNLKRPVGDAAKKAN